MSLRVLIPAALLLAAPAAASGAPESDFSPTETREIMDGYGKCVVARQPKKASEAILGNVSNRVIFRKYRSLIIGDCLVEQIKDGGEMRFTGDLYRYALADALVSRELADQPAPDLSGVPLLSHPETPEMPSDTAKSGKKLSEKAYAEAMKDFHDDVALAFLSRYGECVVRAEPARSKALALSAPTSAVEKAAFDALRPTLATCVPKGRTLKFGLTALRGTIATNYYRLAHAARGAATKAAE